MKKTTKNDKMPKNILIYINRLSIQVQHNYEKNFLSTSKGVR